MAKRIFHRRRFGPLPKWRKRVVTLLFVGLAGLLLLGATNLAVMAAAGRHIVPQAKAKGADAIIVLGAMVWENGQPSGILRDRLDVACELYEAHAAPKILVSGDHGRKDYDEVNAMRRYLENKGVPTEDIFMDHAGFDTYATMYRAGAIFGVKNAVVVTQKYHLYRAVYIGLRRGLEVQGVVCNNYHPARLRQLFYDVRESAARTKDFFQTFLRLRPKYLGESIPISGSGVVTHDGN